MAGEGNSAENGKSGVWTEEAKYTFLLHMILHLKDSNRPINWSKIKMGDRSTKSLQNQWTKVNKQVAEIEAQQPQDGSPAPTPAKRGRKRAPKNEDAIDEDDEVKPAKKRAAGKSAVKLEQEVKKELMSDLEDAEI